MPVTKRNPSKGQRKQVLKKYFCKDAKKDYKEELIDFQKVKV